MTSAPARRRSILVVDDVPENLDILKDALKGDYAVRVANSGALALRIAQQANRPDLILLDIMMPGMDGYEVMRQLQAGIATRDIPVIFLTALAEAHDELKGLTLGARDYIAKPFSVPVVKARIATQLALHAAQERIEAQNAQLMQERELIEEIIARMRDAKSFDGRHLRFMMSSVDRTNGDILLSAFLPDGRQWVLVGDIAGHGPAAAVSVPAISNVFYRRAKRECCTAGDVLAELNAVMYEKLPASVYMPYGFVEIAADRAQFRLWNGGLAGCALVGDGQCVVPYAPTTLPLGVVAAVALDGPACRQEVFPAQARLYLFTDGLSELPSPTGQPLRAPALLAFLAQHPGPLDIDAVRQMLEHHHGNHDFPDDMTLVEIDGRSCAAA